MVLPNNLGTGHIVENGTALRYRFSQTGADSGQSQGAKREALGEREGLLCYRSKN